MTDIKKKKVLITGATGGFGAELIKSFLKEGAELILTDLNHESLVRVTNENSSQGEGKILGHFPSDLSTEAGCREAIVATKKITSVPDIIVNNAGIAILGSFHNIPSEKWEKIISINTLAPMRITHAFLSDMVERKSGHIVNVSSVAGLVATPGLSTYCTSKFAIRAFGESIANEVGKFGVNVTNVYPFFTRTPILESEQIGFSEKLSIPDMLLSEPKDVIADLLDGVKNNTVHVYPGPIAKSLEAIGRIAPWALQMMTTGLIK
ncbi:MAG: SDR family NAD(P)-dependent oxidoreductase [Leptospiraceae bacterium]|nr:SDR family NAD(P)-dependent oxidoreductase [Leptospiraceae bacterium]